MNTHNALTRLAQSLQQYANFDLRANTLMDLEDALRSAHGLAEVGSHLCAPYFVALQSALRVHLEFLCWMTTYNSNSWRPYIQMCLA